MNLFIYTSPPLVLLFTQRLARFSRNRSSTNLALTSSSGLATPMAVMPQSSDSAIAAVSNFSATRTLVQKLKVGQNFSTWS
jgi:hypothetical protein